MLKKFIQNVWLLVFITSIFVLLLALYQSITFSSIGAPQFVVYAIGPMLIIASSYLHLNYLVKLLSIIQIVIYLSAAVILIEIPDKLTSLGHLLLLPVITNFYSSWCASVWHTQSKIRKFVIITISIFYFLSFTSILLTFTSDLFNKLTFLSALIALLSSIVGSFLIQKKPALHTDIDEVDNKMV